MRTHKQRLRMCQPRIRRWLASVVALGSHGAAERVERIAAALQRHPSTVYKLLSGERLMTTNEVMKVAVMYPSPLPPRGLPLESSVTPLKLQGERFQRLANASLRYVAARSAIDRPQNDDSAGVARLS